jgi:hypothetical protein
MNRSPTAEELADETRRVRKVRQLVDIATALIIQSNMTVTDAETLVRWLRARVLTLFPGGENTFEIVYAQRFRRLIREYARHDRLGVVIPFPHRQF